VKQKTSLTDRFILGLTIGLLLGLTLTACAAIKVYVSKPSMGGFYRIQDKELVKYEETENWAGMKQDDFNELLTKYSACQTELKNCNAASK
jgi:hypothetical protein